MKNKTDTCKIMDAVNEFKGVWNNDASKYLHLNSIEGRYLFSFKGYLRAFYGPFTIVCSREEFNSRLFDMTVNFGESPLKHLHIWQEGIKRQPETDEQQSVFTQAMADNGELPKAGMLCLINFPDIDNAWYEYTIDFIGKHMVVATCKEVAERTGHIDNVYFKPIDTRTNKEKAIDEIREEYHAYTGEVTGAFEFAYNKWVGE
jgi:hypothetical protein